MPTCKDTKSIIDLYSKQIIILENCPKMIANKRMILKTLQTSEKFGYFVFSVMTLSCKMERSENSDEI